jgi:hypothetical protein
MSGRKQLCILEMTGSNTDYKYSPIMCNAFLFHCNFYCYGGMRLSLWSWTSNGPFVHPPMIYE